MERTPMLLVILLILFSSIARAEVTIAQPESAVNPVMTAERYPESRFGRAPVKPDVGVGQAYAARQVDEFEAREEILARDTYFGNRAPAGLEMNKVAAQPTITRPSQAQSTSSPVQLAPMQSKEIEPQNLMNSASALTRKGVQEVALIASDLGYFPKTVFVSRDVPVRMYVTGSSKNTLCIMMDSFQVRKQVRSQKIEEITFTPNVPGKYRFYCPVNGMEGTLVVREFTTRVAEGD